MKEQTLFEASIPPLSLISEEVLINSLRASGDWLLTAAAAARAEGTGAGYRDILYFRDGSHRWLYPHSNMGEQIDALLDLWELTGDTLYFKGACAYADAMLDDPERGLYQGEVTEAHGLAYYWRETGSYTGMYSMRAVASMDRLGILTGNIRYTQAARLIAEPLLRQPLESGVPAHFSWIPGEGFFNETAPDQTLGSRVGYLTGVYAYCAVKLQDKRGWTGLERIVATLQKAQFPNGSFPQSFNGKGERVDPSIKNHFHGYLLNGLMTTLSLIPDYPEVLRMAHRLADFSCAQINYFGTTPYCASANNPHATDQAALFFPVSDPAPGLIRLSRLTGRQDALLAAQRLWIHLLLRQIRQPANREAHGITPTTNDPLVTPDPSLKKIGGKGAPHLEENAERLAIGSSYFTNQYVQAGCLLGQSRTSGHRL